jgi:hypothetical protein
MFLNFYVSELKAKSYFVLSERGNQIFDTYSKFLDSLEIVV